jgi:hypothetical protein
MTISTEITINVSEDVTTSLRAFAKSNDIAQTVLYLAICTFKESNPSLREAFYGSGTGGADAHTQISQVAKDVLRFPEAVAGFTGGASAYRKSIADNPNGGEWLATMSNATIARTWKTGINHPELLAKRTGEDGKKKNGIVHITNPRTKKDDKGKDVNVKGSVKIDLEALKEWSVKGVIDFNAERNDAPTDASKGKDPTERHDDNLSRLADLTKQVKASKSGKWKPGCKNSEGKKIEFAMTADMVLELGSAILTLAEACKEHNAMEAAPVAATG